MKCAICGREMDVFIGKNEVENGEYVCNDCLEQHYHQCDECGIYTRIYNGFRYNGETHYLCSDCFDEYYTTCDECGDIVSREDAYYRNGLTLCPDCADNASNDNDYLEEYHHTQAFKFYKTDADMMQEKESGHTPLYLGIELEMESNDYVDNEHIYEMKNSIFSFLDGDYKEDSSLLDGVEIAFQPATYDFIHQNFKSEQFERLRSLGYRSHDGGRCGLHIHINRDFISDNRAEQDIFYSKLNLIFNNCKSQLIEFSRRDYDSLERWASMPMLDIETDAVRNGGASFNWFIDKVKDKTYGRRYMALNDTNYNTIEFRLFRGTLNYKTFMATCELVYNLCYFCKNHNIEDCARVMRLNGILELTDDFVSDYMLERGI